MLSLCKLILGTFDALINHFGSIGGTSFQTAAKFLDAGWLDEDAQGTIAIDLLDVHGTIHIHVEHDILAFSQLLVHLRLQRAVEFVRIDFLVFDELVVGNLLTEFVGREEEVFHAVLLLATRGARCSRDREMEVEFFGTSVSHDAVDDGRFARS